MNRRALLGAAAVLATGALPVWTRLFADEGRMRRPDSRPFPHLPAGQESMPEIKHVVVRAKVFAHVAPSPCPTSGLRQDWNASHLAYNNGRNVGFVRATGPVAMEVLDGLRMPFTYSFGDHRHRRRHVQSPRPERHDLRPARRPRHRVGQLLPERAEHADRPGPAHQTRPRCAAAPLRRVRGPMTDYFDSPARPSPSRRCRIPARCWPTGSRSAVHAALTRRSPRTYIVPRRDSLPQ